MEFLKHVEKTLKQRGSSYGDNLKEISRRWSSLFKTDISPKQVSVAMMELKMVRINNQIDCADSYTDICGYATLAQGDVKPDVPVDSKQDEWLIKPFDPSGYERVFSTSPVRMMPEAPTECDGKHSPVGIHPPGGFQICKCGELIIEDNGSYRLVSENELEKFYKTDECSHSPSDESMIDLSRVNFKTEALLNCVYTCHFCREKIRVISLLPKIKFRTLTDEEKEVQND